MNSRNSIISIHQYILKYKIFGIKLFIKDNFLSFWFRFVYKYRTAIETGNYEYLKKILGINLRTYSDLYHEKMYNESGNYWERGNKNEIDLVAINQMNKYKNYTVEYLCLGMQDLDKYM